MRQRQTCRQWPGSNATASLFPASRPVISRALSRCSTCGRRGVCHVMTRPRYWCSSRATLASAWWASITRTRPTTRDVSSAATAIRSRLRAPILADAPRSNGAFTACRKPSSSAATVRSPISWWAQLRRKTSSRSSSRRSKRRWRACDLFLSGRRFCCVPHQQRVLQGGKHESDRHEAEQLEVDPEVSRLRAPDRLVEDREREEK